MILPLLISKVTICFLTPERHVIQQFRSITVILKVLCTFFAYRLRHYGVFAYTHLPGNSVSTSSNSKEPHASPVTFPASPTIAYSVLTVWATGTFFSVFSHSIFVLLTVASLWSLKMSFDMYYRCQNYFVSCLWGQKWGSHIWPQECMP